MEPDADHLAAMVRRVLEVPLHRALGVALIDPAEPMEGLEIQVVDLAANSFGVLHGGLAPTLLDVSSYLAVLPHLAPGTNAVTHSASCSLLRAVQGGTTVRFRGQIDRVGRTLIFCSSRAEDEDGRVVATGQVVKSIVAVP